MRLIILVLALLVLASLGAAESVKVGSYNVSFNVSQAHEIDLNDIDNGVTIKTFDGKASVIIAKNHTMLDLLASAQDVVIDDVTGKISRMADDERVFLAAYALTPTEEVMIISAIPFYETADFLRSLHVRKES
jgi:hypothetical protein